MRIVYVLVVSILIMLALPGAARILAAVFAAIAIGTLYINAHKHKHTVTGGTPNQRAVGLYLGANSCYMNATIQMMAAIPEIYEYVLRGYPQIIPNIHFTRDDIDIIGNKSHKLERPRFLALYNVFDGIQNCRRNDVVAFRNDYNTDQHHIPDSDRHARRPIWLRRRADKPDWVLNTPGEPYNPRKKLHMPASAIAQASAADLVDGLMQNIGPVCKPLFSFYRNAADCPHKVHRKAEYYINASDTADVGFYINNIAQCNVCADIAAHTDEAARACQRHADWRAAMYHHASKYLLVRVDRAHTIHASSAELPENDPGVCSRLREVTLTSLAAGDTTYRLHGAILHAGDDTSGHYRYIDTSGESSVLYDDARVPAHIPHNDAIRLVRNECELLVYCIAAAPATTNTRPPGAAEAAPVEIGEADMPRIAELRHHCAEISRTCAAVMCADKTTLGSARQAMTKAYVTLRAIIRQYDDKLAAVYTRLIKYKQILWILRMYKAEYADAYPLAKTHVRELSQYVQYYTQCRNYAANYNADPDSRTQISLDDPVQIPTGPLFAADIIRLLAEHTAAPERVAANSVLAAPRKWVADTLTRLHRKLVATKRNIARWGVYRKNLETVAKEDAFAHDTHDAVCRKIEYYRRRRSEYADKIEAERKKHRPKSSILNTLWGDNRAGI